MSIFTHSLFFAPKTTINKYSNAINTIQQYKPNSTNMTIKKHQIIQFNVYSRTDL